MISVGQVMITLQPWLGARLLRALEPCMDEIAHMLNAYSSRQAPDSLQDELDSLLFYAVHEATKGRMLMQLADESWIRIRVEDFATMADELMELVFARFPADSYHLLLLREYSLRRESLSALKTLYTRFASLQSSRELETIASVARNCHPAFRLHGWLD